jgi:hypothetical protein
LFNIGVIVCVKSSGFNKIYTFLCVCLPHTVVFLTHSLGMIIIDAMQLTPGHDEFVDAAWVPVELFQFRPKVTAEEVLDALSDGTGR